MSARVAATAVVHPNVHLGNDVVIEDFCVVGCPPRGAVPGEHATVIGEGALIRSHAVVYAGNRIGARFQAGHAAFLREFNRIGDDVSVGTQSIIEHHVRIGDRVRIHSRAFIPEYCELDEDCWIGPGVVMTNAKYPAAPDAKASLRGALVGRSARIGANATLLPGVHIGAEALVGAGAVVTRDVAPGLVVAGNPARPRGRIDLLPYGRTGAS